MQRHFKREPGEGMSEATSSLLMRATSRAMID
jgi:hypothetical protein